MEQNFVISLGRQIGAGGLETAHRLADEFGIRMLDRELLMEAAKDSGISPEFFEGNDEKSSHKLKLFNLRLFSSHGSTTMTNSVMLDENLFKLQSEVLRKIAFSESCVIVGRCADYILRDHPRMVSVFISADIESRIARMMKSHEGWSEDYARRYIETGDRKRADYYNYYTFKKWGDSSSYNLCVDSSRLGDDIDKVVDVIKCYMKNINLI